MGFEKLTIPLDRPAVVNPLISIVIPCVGQLEYTKLCVASVLKYSRQPFDLVFLDIGSLDGTAEYLEGLKMGCTIARVDVVRALTDLEISSACQDAFSRCRGEYIVLLNNDTIVTPHWLVALTSLAKLTSNIGLVGPMSNYAAPPQLVESVSYRSGPRKMSCPSPLASHPSSLGVEVDEVVQFAERFHEQTKGKWIEVDRLGGFCLLIKKEVYKTLEQRGELSKWTDLPLFDTDILSVKARQAGFGLALCRDLFVHHFGTRTFAHGAVMEVMARAS